MDNWKETILGDILKVKHGFAFKGKFIDKQPNNNILVTPGNFHIGGGFKSSKFKYYFGEIPEDYILREGDIVVTMTDLSKESDTLGYSAKIPSSKNGEIYLHNQRIGLLEFIVDDVSKDFIYWLLRTFDYHWYVVSSASGSAIMHTSPTRICQYEFNLPPLPQQKAIAEVLSSLDDKIDLLHRQNKTLEAMAETLFRQWFVEEADESWEEGTLKDEFEILMGQSPPGDSYNEFAEGMPMYQGNKDFGFRFPTNRVFTTEPKRIAKPMDTLISVRAPVGAQNMANEQCCIGRGVAAFRHLTNPDFYSYTYFKLRFMLEDIRKFNNEGTVFGSISKSDFQKMETDIPFVSDIEKIQEKIKPIDDKVISNTKQIQSLTNLRDTLLPKLMSGEVRIKMNND